MLDTHQRGDSPVREIGARSPGRSTSQKSAVSWPALRSAHRRLSRYVSTPPALRLDQFTIAILIGGPQCIDGVTRNETLPKALLRAASTGHPVGIRLPNQLACTEMAEEILAIYFITFAVLVPVRALRLALAELTPTTLRQCGMNSTDSSAPSHIGYNRYTASAVSSHCNGCCLSPPEAPALLKRRINHDRRSEAPTRP